MIARLYQKLVLKNPKIVFLLLIVALVSFGNYSKNFRLDASSETLLIEGDPDLEYLREVTDRYGSKEFLVLTYTPNEDMISDNSINNLLSLKYKIQSLNWVHSVITLLDIPLLNNSDESLQERLKNFKTLKDEDVELSASDANIRQDLYDLTGEQGVMPGEEVVYDELSDPSSQVGKEIDTDRVSDFSSLSAEAGHTEGLVDDSQAQESEDKPKRRRSLRRKGKSDESEESQD